MRKTDTQKTATEACMIIDVQEQYTSYDLPSFERLVERLPEIRARMPVIWVFMQGYGKPVNPVRATRSRLVSLYNSLARPGTVLPSNQPLLSPDNGEYFLTKRSCDVFTDGLMDPFLKARGICDLYFTGYAASICVAQSAAGALSHGYRSAVLRDLTGETDAGASRAELLDYRRRGIPYLTSKDLLHSPR